MLKRNGSGTPTRNGAIPPTKEVQSLKGVMLILPHIIRALPLRGATQLYDISIILYPFIRWSVENGRRLSDSSRLLSYSILSPPAQNRTGISNCDFKSNIFFTVCNSPTRIAK